MKKLRVFRSWLLLVVIIGLLALAPLDLLAELNSYFQSATVSTLTSYKANLRYNLARPDLEHPGEFMMAANLTPVANYFDFVLKLLSVSIAKTKSLKVLGTARHLHLVSLVIMLFYLFYYNSRTTADADPLDDRKGLNLAETRCAAFDRALSPLK